MLRGTLLPFYFGTPSRQLYGCYHFPKAGLNRESAVVLCNPLGEEYVRFHRAFRQLAERLSVAGFPVLRFDFYGCGDSAGDAEEGRVAQWLTDISTAVDEVSRRGRVKKICLVGLRFGAALSAIVGVDRQDIDRIVLWDPVVSGKDHLDELGRLHREMLGRAHVKRMPQPAGEHQTELLGFPMSNSMMTDIEHLDLFTISHEPANRILIIESHEGTDRERLVRHLQKLNVKVTHQQILLPQLWTWSEDVGRILVPQQILQSVVAWISEEYS
jgi:pimeloyl-ACP methyl ester carboxylesterase